MKIPSALGVFSAGQLSAIAGVLQEQFVQIKKSRPFRLNLNEYKPYLETSHRNVKLLNLVMDILATTMIFQTGDEYVLGLGLILGD